MSIFDYRLGKRVAVVIGNSDYVYAQKLPSARNDAQALSSVLERIGFLVIPGYDLGINAMDETFQEFKTKLERADVALFYFAGHGLQVNGRNYLIPIDAQLRQEWQLERQTFNVNEQLDIISHSVDTSLLFLDACRDNPFAQQLLSAARSGLRRGFVPQLGLAKMNAGRGTFIAYAAAPGETAID